MRTRRDDYDSLYEWVHSPTEPPSPRELPRMIICEEGELDEKLLKIGYTKNDASKFIWKANAFRIKAVGDACVYCWYIEEDSK